MTVWLLTLWLCTSPGPTGDCRREVQVFATRVECLRASFDAGLRSVAAMARCHMRRDPPIWDADEAPV